MHVELAVGRRQNQPNIDHDKTKLECVEFPPGL